MNGIRTCLKKSRISKILVSAIIPLVLLLSFLGSSRKVYASEEVVPPQAYVTPNVEITGEGDYHYSFTVTIIGEYVSFYWERYVETGWTKQGDSDGLFVWSSSYAGDFDRRMRVKVAYDTPGGLAYTYSNEVYLYNEDNNTVPEIMKFTDFANILLYKFVEWFDIVVDFLIENPVSLVGIFMVMIVAAIGIMRHLVGGSDAEKVVSN